MQKRPSNEGLCRLCGCWSILQNSHALPDSLFRSLFKKGSGSAVHIDCSPDGEVRRTQDSWAEYLLCSGCESKLNSQYDVCGNRFTNGTGITIEKCGNFDRVAGIDMQRLRMYFVSVLWRMAESNEDNYRSVLLPRHVREEVAQCLRENTVLSERTASVRLQLAIDPSGSDGFTRDHLATLIVSPWCDLDKIKHSVTFRFFHAGYLVSIRFPGVAVKDRKQLGLLTGKADLLLIPSVDIFSIPKVVDMLVTGYGKSVEGKVSKGVQKLTADR